MRSRILPMPALAILLCGGCSLPQSVLHFRSPAGHRARPVALVTDGSAFERSAARNAVAATLERATRREVVLVDAPTSPADVWVKGLAARFARENPRLDGYDWQEPQCAAESLLLTAVEHDVGAVYRVSLSRTRRWRPASDREIREHAMRHAARRVLATVRLARSGVVLEDALSGTIALSSFTGPGVGRRVTVARRATLVDPTPFTPRVHVGPLVRDTVRGLPPPRDPQWDAVARRLLASGCPFLALVVAEVRPVAGRSQQDIRTAALGAIRQQVEQRAAVQIADETSRELAAALHENRLDVAASVLARYAARPDSRRETVSELSEALENARRRTAGRGGDEGPYSCSALCAIHMVDICNRDRALWESNRRPWEQTACGTRRPEAFLKDCYQQQWLTGAYHEGCIVPCERTMEGRDRLIAILRGAGCRIRVS